MITKLLRADGLSRDAVARIFAAKSRPSDNPLILHIAARRDPDALVDEIPPAAEAAMTAFVPCISAFCMKIPC